MNVSFQIIILLASFLMGSVPFGLIVARAFKIKNLRAQGSGNVGATNVARVIGFWPAGFLTFLLDTLKGVVPIAVIAYTAVPEAIGSLLKVSDAQAQVTPLLLWSIGTCAILGHCFSPWLHFKGGKGVATGFGVMLILSPISAVIGAIGFACSFLLTHVSSISSLTGLTLTAVAYLIMNPAGAHVFAGAVFIFVILIRHESNLDALLEGRERKFK